MHDCQVYNVLSYPLVRVHPGVGWGMGDGGWGMGDGGWGMGDGGWGMGDEVGGTLVYKIYAYVPL